MNRRHFILFRPETLGILLLFSLGVRPLDADPIRPHPVIPASKMKRAVDLMALGRLKEADALLQKFTENEPDKLDAELGRAQIAVTQKDLRKAETLVDGILSRQGNLPEAHNMKGVLLLLKKDDAGAQGEFTRAMQLQPKYITPRLYLAVMARVRGNFPEAAQDYKGITDVAPQLPVGYLGEAEALTMQHREGDALKVLESWKAADPKTILPYQVLANIALTDGKPAEAIRQLQAALGKSPNDAHTLTLLGDAYAVAGNAALASEQYQAAMVASNGSNPEAALHLGTLEAGAGHTDQALYYFRMVLKADPTNPVACNDSAFLLANQGTNLKDALTLAETAVKHAPKYADAKDTLGYVQYRKGEYALAVATLQQAKTLDPGSKDIAAHLGLAYAKTGHKQEALAELRRALQPGPSDLNRPELERTVAELSKP
jgi:Flp pilus assembly protein TadD